MTQTINAIYMKLTTAGTDGTATATGTTVVPGGIQGLLYSIYVKPLVAGWAAGTDITITETGGPARTILTLTNKSSAAASYPVRVAETGATGTALTSYVPMAFDAVQFTVTMAEANVDTDALEVWFYLMR
jgi:hypothetical protein